MDKNNEPILISCVMAVNKDDGFLDEAINSILAQSFSDFEFIIVANNCDDIFFNRLIEYERRDLRIRVYRTSIPQLPYNLNFGIDKSNGKYIARMDADDISEKNRFEEQVRYLQANPEVVVLGTNFERINDKGMTIPSNYIFYKNYLDIKRNMKLKCCICHPTVMLKKEVFLKTGGYAYGFTAEDYDLWLRMLDQGAIIHNHPMKLLKYRTHLNSVTNNKSNLKRNIAYTTSLLYRKFVETKDSRYLLGMFIAGGWGIRLVRFRAWLLRFFRSIGSKN
ncbi:glycosyltransferase [Chitinophaga sp. MM2321]|uniref:glycosyltransferase n=1 Tax=Chitinophaga sp. MM2321 TaxID=3137178 RepID=UPI0032D574D7